MNEKWPPVSFSYCVSGQFACAKLFLKGILQPTGVEHVPYLRKLFLIARIAQKKKKQLSTLSYQQLYLVKDIDIDSKKNIANILHESFKLATKVIY